MFNLFLRDYLEEGERLLVEPILSKLGLREDIEGKAMSYAISNLVTQHIQEVRSRKEELVQKTIVAVRDRLTREINYWDAEANKLKAQEAAGKTNARLNSQRARQRANDLEIRLHKRLAELEQERQLSPLPPVVVGGALVVPAGLLQRLQGKRSSSRSLFAKETQRVEQLAMAAVMAAERALGHEPKDVGAEKLGYDIESRVPETETRLGHLRLIEVKGRIAGAEMVTVTKNEILYALNKPDNFILALVRVPNAEEFTEGDAFKVSEKKGAYLVEAGGCVVRYVHQPFQREPDVGVGSVNYHWKELWEKGEKPT